MNEKHFLIIIGFLIITIFLIIRRYNKTINIIKNKSDNERTTLLRNMDFYKKHSLNIGEALSYRILREIKKEFIKNNIITEEEMTIINNVYIPINYKGRMRQIDHVILLPWRIFVIETKYWNGKVYYGINQNNIKNYPILNELLEFGEEKETKTIVFRKKQNIDLSTNRKKDSLIYEIHDYDCPYNQSDDVAFELRKFLSKNNNKINYIPGLVFFVREKDDYNNVKVFKDSNVATSKEELKELLISRKDNNRNYYSLDDIKSIINQIKSVNHHLIADYFELSI